MRRLLFVLVSLATACNQPRSKDTSSSSRITQTQSSCKTSQEGDEKCSGAVLKACEDNEWVKVEDCADSEQTCLESSDTSASCVDGGTTTPTCTTAQAGDERCRNNSRQRCESEQWRDFEDCSLEDMVCEADGAVTICNTGGGGGGGTCPATGSTVTCSGTELVFCDAGVEDRADCADLATDGSIPGGTCYDYQGDIGPNCLFQSSEPCVLFAGEDMYVFGCGTTSLSSTMACDFDEGCKSGFSECDSLATFTKTCSGNTLIFGCNMYNQEMLLNCGGERYGAGTCNTTTDVCQHSTQGAYCDDTYVLCTGGLSCVVPTEGGAGTCEL